MKRWLYTSGGNRLSKRRRIAKRKKALVAMMSWEMDVRVPNIADVASAPTRKKAEKEKP